MSLEIKALHKQAFREIFNLVANKEEQKLNKEGLKSLFQMINYQLDENQYIEIEQKLFNKKDYISFDEFLKIFTLKLNDYTFHDVRNAFRLIAKDDDKFISLAKIKKILSKHALSDVEIEFLTRQLEPFIEPGGKVNYQDFIRSLEKI